MEHPNVFYFDLASNLVLVLVGVVFLAGLLNKGPYKTINVTRKWVQSVIGVPSMVFGLIGLYMNLGEIFGV